MDNNSDPFGLNIFTFFIGENQRPIPVHAAIVAKQSEAFNTLITGSMSEAQNQSASIPDISEDEFLKFCQFAYFGDYSTPKCTIRSEADPQAETNEEFPSVEATEESLPAAPENEESQPVPPSEDLWRIYRPKKEVRKPAKAPLFLEYFQNRSYCPVLPRQTLFNSCEVVTNANDREDFTPVFLGHARVYVLADRYGVEPLRSLCLHKLHKTLLGLTLHEGSIEDIIELVRFSFNNTPEEGNDKLRELILGFLASRYETIGVSSPFLALLEEGSDFVREFWLFVQKNLIA